MSSWRWHGRWGWAALLVLAPAGGAQQITPHVGYVYPAGGRQGAAFEVTVGGQFLDGINSAYISGDGASATLIEHVKPLTPAQANKLRDQLRELTAKKGATDDDRKTMAEIRVKLAAFVRRPSSPSIAEIVRLRVTMAPEAAPGERELRLATPLGLTNPLVFCVGQLPEFSKQAAKVSTQAPAGPPAPPVNVTLPATINGQIAPGGVDRYRFPATKGQRLVIAASARELMPYISDAVPGWFQATLALYDAKGKEVGYADDFRFHPDPVLYYEVPEDGEYLLEIKDSIYRGREDFVYRIEAGELPFVTGIFPLGGKAGARTTVEVKGWNLPVSKVNENAKGKAAGVYPLSVRQGERFSNHVPFALDAVAERVEKEPNDQAKSAQKVKLPIILNGRIDRPGDQDVYRFQGRAGEEIVAEVFARRLDSPLDSTLRLTDSSGRPVAANDDFEDKGAGLLTHQADSRISVRLPKNGTYHLHLGDTQHKGGAEYAYRLRISRPRPDFELRVVPASVNLRPGGVTTITVYALRRDGFAGDIALRLKDAPAGFTLSGAWVPAGQEKVRLTLSAPPGRVERPFSLSLEGRASIQGKDVRRPAVPAEDMMQAFAYRHLVPAKEWMVRVVGAGRPNWQLSGGQPVKLQAGKSAPVRLVLPRGRAPSQLRLALSEPPEGISIQEVSLLRDGLSILLRAEPGKVKPGLKGNLIVESFLERPNTRRQPQGTLPAIPFEVFR